VSIVARVIRQFGTVGAVVTLERAVVLPSTPTLGRESIFGPKALRLRSKWSA
jgi:hypothetical protein